VGTKGKDRSETLALEISSSGQPDASGCSVYFLDAYQSDCKERLGKLKFLD
jgi:hypothetical protein